MKPIGEAAAKAARHRKFHWCRRPNGFCDLPIWSVVAEKLAMPLHQVLAFVNRLEELGNAAANYGEIRGNLARFKPAEFGKALGMPAEDCARIYAALEEPDIGWIAYDHIADFYDRNPDREDEGAAERKRRQRLRDAIRRQLAKLAFHGKIAEHERRAIEEVLGGSEAELRNLQAKLAQAELSKNLSTEDDVTRDGRMSQRDIVTVTPEKSRDVTGGAVDKSGGRAPSSGSAGEITDPGIAELFLAVDGKQIVADRMRIPGGLAETTMARWRRELGDDAVALVAVIQSALATTDPGRPSHFQIVVTNQIKQRQQLAKGLQLPLGPVGLRRTDRG